jgi:DNA-binding transcriptional LysR family regulator
VELNITDGQPDKGAGLDLNFVFGAPMAVDAQMVVRSSRVIVAAERYLRQASEPTSPTDLSEHPFILTKTTNTGLPLQLEKAGQRRSIPLKGWLTCDCTLSTQVAVVSGLGIAVVPAWLFHSEIASGQVKPLLADWNLPAIEVWACPSTNSPAHSSEAERFVSSLKEWALERTP